MKTLLSTLTLFIGFTSALMAADPAYRDPAGGWLYRFDGAAAAGGGGFTALDGTWGHSNGSDEWDGSAIGVGNPGGVSALVEAEDFIRFQDTGDPRDYGFPDPGSNRKIFLGHDIGADGAGPTVLNDGVTLSFRARIPTAGLLDPLHPDGGGGMAAYPAGGDGYLLHDGGKDNFGVKQSSGGLISFALATDFDGQGAGLHLNNLNGTAVSGDVDSGEGGTRNLLGLDPTVWHEFWITIQSGGAGTHQVDIYIDGALTPTTFDVTAGSGDDFGGLSYISMGVGSTGQSGALDVDFYAVQTGVHLPQPFLTVDSPPGIVDLSPAPGALFQPAAAGLSFRATTLAPNTLAVGDMVLLLNGVDVSAGLIDGGTPTEKLVSYAGLEANRIYQAVLTVTDQDGRSTTVGWGFDTFDELTAKVVEVEDYNFDEFGFCDPEFDGAFYVGPAGGFLDDAFPGAYRGLLGVPEIDWHDEPDFAPALTNEFNAYRKCDGADIRVSPDQLREGFVLEGVPDYEAHLLQPGDWMNYSRTVAAGNYRAYLRVRGGATRELSLSRVTSDPAQQGQSTFVLGNFSVGDTGGAYEYVELTDPGTGEGVVFSLSDLSTLRLTAVNSANDVYPNFFILVPTADPTTLAGPIVVGRTPADGAAEVRLSDPVGAEIVNRASAVNLATVGLSLNGVDVTADALIEDSGTGATIEYAPAGQLAAGTSYTVEVVFEDELGNAYSDAWGFITTADVTPPHMVYAKALYVEPGMYELTVTFSEPVDPALGLDPLSYMADNGLTVFLATAGRDDRTVLLFGNAAVDGGVYTLHASGIADLIGNTGDSEIQFVISSGIITSVVEIGGDAGPPASWSGQTFDHVTLGNPTYVVPRFAEDVEMYTDRNHQWNGARLDLPLPPYLAGCEYIMSQNNNRDNDPFQLDVTVSALADVYLLIDNRLNDGSGDNPPTFTTTNMQWVLDQGWAPVTTGWNRAGDLALPDEAGADEGADGVGPGAGINQYVSIYTKQFGAGTFSLFQAQNVGRNFYGVVVSPAIGLAPLQIELGAGEVVLLWTGGGQLQVAETVNGPWDDILDATSPHPYTLTGEKRFFRLRQ